MRTLFPVSFYRTRMIGTYSPLPFGAERESSLLRI